MFPVRAPVVPKLGLLVHAPRKKPQLNNQPLPPLNPLITITNKPVKSARVPKSKLPELQRTNGEPYFTGTINPLEAISKFPFLLTDKEHVEILHYDNIYYIRQQPPHSKVIQKASPNFFHFVPNDHVAYRYQQIEVLGKGSFGSVIKCLDHKTGQYVAIKFLRDTKKVHDEILFENKIISRLQDGENSSSSGIIRYIESFTFRDFFCIVMELLWKDTYTVLEARHFIGYSKGIIKMIAFQTAQALDFMHQKNIVHCDIKPENIMFVTDHKKSIKIIDFGCSCFGGEIMFTYIQSRFYRAPEVVLGIEYNKEIDIWSLGCVLCELVTGKPLFDADTQPELLAMIVEMFGLPPKSLLERAPFAKKFFDSNGVKLQHNKGSRAIGPPNSRSLEAEINVSDPNFIDFISGCLRWEPSDRYTASELMSHPFLRDLNSNV